MVINILIFGVTKFVFMLNIFFEIQNQVQIIEIEKS